MLENLNKLSLGWVVGFLEGEGHFTLNKNTPKSPNAHYTAYAAVGATQKTIEPLEWLQEMFGGKITKRKNGVHEWELESINAIDLAKELQPYMSSRRQKQIQAVIDGEVRIRRGAEAPQS